MKNKSNLISKEIEKLRKATNNNIYADAGIILLLLFSVIVLLFLISILFFFISTIVYNSLVYRHYLFCLNKISKKAMEVKNG